MQQPGLYYPFVHIRDDDWLKLAALYWPEVRRLVPSGYPKRDSETARVFAAEKILRDEDPGEWVDQTKGPEAGVSQVWACQHSLISKSTSITA